MFNVFDCYMLCLFSDRCVLCLESVTMLWLLIIIILTLYMPFLLHYIKPELPEEHIPLPKPKKINTESLNNPELRIWI